MPDFRMQQSFPISEVINASQRKAELEQKFKNQNTELLNSSLEKIGTIGASLLDRRKRMAQAMLLSQQPEVKDMLSGGDRQVTTGPTGQPVRIDQTAQGGVGVEPQKNAPAMPAQNAALLLEGQDPLAVMKQAFTRKQAMNPLVDKVAQLDAAGNIIGYTSIAHSKGAKTLFTKPQPPGGGAKDDRIRQLAAARVKEKVVTDINEIARGQQQMEGLFAKYNKIVKSGKAGNPITGGLQQGLAKISGGKFGTEDIKAFMDVRDGLIASLKKVTGDTGVLTEQDATRLVGLLSSLSEDPGAAKSKIADIRAIFSSSRQRAELKGNNLIKEIQSGLDITPIDSQAITDLSGGATSEPPVAAPPAPKANPDLVHLSTKELMDLRAKMTAHKEPKKS